MCPFILSFRFGVPQAWNVTQLLPIHQDYILGPSPPESQNFWVGLNASLLSHNPAANFSLLPHNLRLAAYSLSSTKQSHP